MVQWSNCCRNRSKAFQHQADSETGTMSLGTGHVMVSRLRERQLPDIYSKRRIYTAKRRHIVEQNKPCTGSWTLFRAPAISNVVRESKKMPSSFTEFLWVTKGFTYRTDQGPQNTIAELRIIDASRDTIHMKDGQLLLMRHSHNLHTHVALSE